MGVMIDMNNSYESVMARKNEIMRKSVGIDFDKFETGKIGFDYEALLKEGNLSLEIIKEIQHNNGVGGTPLKNAKILLH
jgi:hypothetical protein